MTTRRQRSAVTPVTPEPNQAEDLEVLEAETRNMEDEAKLDALYEAWGRQVIEPVVEMKDLSDEQVATLAMLTIPRKAKPL